MNFYFLHLIAFGFLIFVDQISKSKAIGLSSYVINKGFLLNFLGGAPLSIKIISIATFASLLFLIYLLFLYFTSNKASGLKVGLTTLIAGICSNSIDKILRGYTVDFIPFIKSSFNIADIYILSSIVFILYYIIRFRKIIWIDDNERKFKLVYPREQVQLALKFSFIVFATSLFLGTLAFTFIKTYIGPVVLESQKIISIFLFLYGTMTAFFILLVFIFGLMISNRTAGPIYALERFVAKLRAGENVSLKLREKDSFKKIEEIAENLKRAFSDKD